MVHFTELPIILWLFILITSSSALPLNAIKSNAHLLSPRSSTASVYDGMDTIYIFGGWYYDPELELIPYADIHAYNITSDTIQVIGQLPRTSWSGIGHFDPTSGQIYFLRGDGTFLWRYDPRSGITESVSEWSGNSASITGAFTADNQLVTFGGLEDPLQIYRFDLISGEQGPIGTLPQKSELSVGIYVPEMKTTFLFAGEMGNRNPVLMAYDHSTNTTKVLNTVFPSWRHGDGRLVAVNGKSICLIGAAINNGAWDNGVTQFIPDDSVHEGIVNFFHVDGLPDELTDSSTVFVKELNRIYLFGGYDLFNVDRDEIWYINF